MNRMLLVVPIALAACTVEDSEAELPLFDPFSAVRVDAERVDVVIRATEGRPTLGWDLQYTGDKPEVEWWIADDALQVAFRCVPGVLVCRGEIVVEAQRDTAAYVLQDTGSVAVRNLRGAVDLETNTGDVELYGLGGSSTIVTRTGAIAGNALQAPDLLARTHSGKVELRFLDTFDLVDVETITGDIALRVPHDSYECLMRSDTGKVTSEGIVDLPGAEHRIRAITRSGKIAIEGS